MRNTGYIVFHAHGPEHNDWEIDTIEVDAPVSRGARTLCVPSVHVVRYLGPRPLHLAELNTPCRIAGVLPFRKRRFY